MSTDTSSKHYFLTLVGVTPSDRTVKTKCDDILTIRVAQVSQTSDFILMNKPNDSFVCDLEIIGD